MPVVAISRYLPQQQLDRIQAVDSSIELRYDPALALPADGRLALLYPPHDPHGPGTGGTVPRPLSAADERRWLDLLSPAEIMFDADPAYLDALPECAPGLRWIQGIASGAGEMLGSDRLRRSGIQIAAARGVHDDALADFTLMAILAHGKQLPALRGNQRQRRWTEIPAAPLAGRRLCIVGYGGIGRAVAERASAFGLHITAVRRSGRASPGADRSLPPEQLHRALAEADYVAVTLPATPTTHHLFDAGTLAALKPGAYLVNVGRGSVVDEQALADALRSGRLAGAALDVFETEPLPADSPLWDLDTVTLSPHCTSLMPGVSLNRIVDLFCENLRRHLDGRQPLHLVDRNAGY